MLCSVVWFHTKSKPHNDCHKSGFFTTFFCSATVTVVQVHCTATSPFTCLRLYPYPPSKQHTSIPDQCRCQHQHCWKSIQRCRWTPKSLLAFTKHSEVGYVDWGPSGSRSALAISQNVGEKNRLFVYFCPFFVFAIEVHFWFKRESRSNLSSHPCLQPCPLMAGQSTLKLTSLSGLLGLWVVPGMYEGQGSWTGQELGWSKLPGSLSKVVPKEFGRGTSHGWSIGKQETQHQLLDSLRSRHCISAPKSSTCSPCVHPVATTEPLFPLTWTLRIGWNDS